MMWHHEAPPEAAPALWVARADEMRDALHSGVNGTGSIKHLRRQATGGPPFIATAAGMDGGLWVVDETWRESNGCHAEPIYPNTDTLNMIK